MRAVSKAAETVLSEIREVMRNGRPRHSGEIHAELIRRGVDVNPVVLGRLLRRVHELEQDGVVEAPNANGGGTKHDVWRLK